MVVLVVFLVDSLIHGAIDIVRSSSFADRLFDLPIVVLLPAVIVLEGRKFVDKLGWRMVAAAMCGGVILGVLRGIST